MRFYKLRVTPNATTIASTFNEQFKPEVIASHNDPYQVEWIDESSNAGDVVTGEKACYTTIITLKKNTHELFTGARDR